MGFGMWVLVASDKLRVEAYLNKGERHAKALFDEMAANKTHWDAMVGQPLDWQRLDGGKACRIAACHPLDLDDEASRAEAKTWAVATADKMFTGLDAELCHRALAVKAALAAEGVGEEPEDPESEGEEAEDPPATTA